MPWLERDPSKKLYIFFEPAIPCEKIITGQRADGRVGSLSGASCITGILIHLNIAGSILFLSISGGIQFLLTGYEKVNS
jgi:hypothetical protein